MSDFSNFMEPFKLAIDLIIGTCCILVVLLALRKFRETNKGSISVKTPVGEISMTGEKKEYEDDGESEPADRIPYEPPEAPTLPPPPGPTSSMMLRHHMDCPFAKDFIIVMSKSIRFGAELNNIEEKFIIRDQMNSAQIKVEQIKSLMEKCYVNVLYRKRGTDINLMQDSSYLIFIHFVSEVGKSALLEIKGYFRDNGLAEFSDEAYEDYVQEHANKILNNFKMYLTMMLPTAIDPTRIEFEKEYASEQTVSYNFLKEAFYTARDISIRWKKIIAQKETDFDKEILELTGITAASKI